jgi:hypothetical protein
MPDKKPDPVDATTSVSPQPSIDPVYQAGKTVGATDKSPRPPRAAAPSNLRSVLPRGSRPRNVDYPGTLYHPVLGARYVNDSNEANELPGPAHNWWPTAEEADMHRTDLEAQEVIHHARSWKNEVNLAMIDGEPLPIDSSTVNEKTGEVTVDDTNKPVRYSVQAEEVLKRGGVEPH